MLLRKLLIQFLVLSLMLGAMVVTPMHAASHFQQQQPALDLQQQQIIQLRAAVIASGSALAFAQADMTSLARQSPGPQSQALKASLVEEDLVICQTGCLSHGEYWRVQDHCNALAKPAWWWSSPRRYGLCGFIGLWRKLPLENDFNIRKLLFIQ